MMALTVSELSYLQKLSPIKIFNFAPLGHWGSPQSFPGDLLGPMLMGLCMCPKGGIKILPL